MHDSLELRVYTASGLYRNAVNSELLSNGTTFKWNYFQKQPSSHLYSYKPHVPLTDLFPALKLFATCFDMTSLANSGVSVI